MRVTLGNKEYEYLIAYQHEDKYRVVFNNLAEKIFSLSFEVWYESGYWREKYIPYTLFDAERAVANVSVNIMDFITLGKQQRYIQIGTVMTDEDSRHKNLNRFLMEKVLEEWNKQCDFIYLFANKTVLEMYPKYGFERVKEYEYFKSVKKNAESTNYEKLNMDNQSNREMLHDYAKNSKVFGKLSMRENADLVLFYAITILKDNIYYIKSLDVIAIATFKDNQLRLWDIFSKVELELDEVIYSLVNMQIDEIVFGFTPMECSAYKFREILSDDALFVQKDKTKLFDENKVMFPLLSHA